MKPAHAAVDNDKRHNLIAVARDYLRHGSPSCQWRFDIVSVYYELQSTQPQFELFQNASPAA
jgi:Holliday junction resolvase-like predicted endonuclease